MSQAARRRAAERGLVISTGILLIAGFLALLLWRVIFIPILPGHVGVLYRLLFNGTVVDHVYGEGLAIKWPWNRMYIFDVRTQSMPLEVHGLSAEGMSSTFDVVVLYRPRIQKTPQLLKEIGLDYHEKVVAPIVTREVREKMGGFSSTELFSIDRTEIQNQILAGVRETQQAEFIDFQTVLIKKIELPKMLGDAITEKLAQEQLAQSYVFRLQGQRSEAERLKIEATGLRDFYSIVGNSLTDRLLTWRGIEATVSLAKSPNTKIVIVGSGKDQLPLILGSDIQNIKPQSTTDAGSAAASPASPSAPAASGEATPGQFNILADPILPGITKPLVPPIAPSIDPAETGH